MPKCQARIQRDACTDLRPCLTCNLYIDIDMSTSLPSETSSLSACHPRRLAHASSTETGPDSSVSYLLFFIKPSPKLSARLEYGRSRDYDKPSLAYARSELLDFDILSSTRLCFPAASMPSVSRAVVTSVTSSRSQIVKAYRGGTQHRMLLLKYDILVHVNISNIVLSI